jgi:acetyl esterase/lipase
VWRRADLAADAKAPVLVQVHGGAWMSGNKEQQGGPLMSHLAERGWVCVAVNYRLSPRATWPDHIVDVKRALAWVKQNIAEHGGDPEFVVITGGSAGGHLSSLAALTPGVAAFQPGFEDADTAVQAAVPMYGVYDFTNRDGTSRSDMEPMLRHLVFKSPFADSREVWEQASSMSWVGPDAPPFMIVHGANDSLAPVEQARSFAAMLRVASNEPVVYAELPRAQHAFDILHSVRTRRTVEAIDRFLAVVRTEHAVEHPGEAGA